MDTSIKIKKKSREDHSPLTNRSVSIDFSDVSKSKKGKKSTASLSIETPEPIVTSDRRYSWLSGGPKIVNVNSSNLSSLIKVKSIKRPRETTVFGRQMAEVRKQILKIEARLLISTYLKQQKHSMKKILSYLDAKSIFVYFNQLFYWFKVDVQLVSWELEATPSATPFFKTAYKISHPPRSLVTQPMLQHRPNRTELRSMDSYVQILCRFQKCTRKVPPPSILSTKK